jgi:hypothetical protein
MYVPLSLSLARAHMLFCLSLPLTHATPGEMISPCVLMPHTLGVCVRVCVHWYASACVRMYVPLSLPKGDELLDGTDSTGNWGAARLQGHVKRHI